MAPTAGAQVITICIYQRNRGLGKCVGPVSRVKVARKQMPAWQGLQDLAERLKATGEEPGVCKAHEKRAGENGYLVDMETGPPEEKSGRPGRRSPDAPQPTKAAGHPRAGDA